MKKFFATAALALSLAAAGASAQAASTALTFVDGTTDIGNTISLPKGTSFTDTYTFTYSGAFDVSSAVISMALGKTSALNVTAFTLTNVATNAVYVGTGGTTGSLTTYSIEASGLTAGNYVLTVTGSVTGSTGGSYGGNISISAVPEASTTAMMLGGLALVGFVATRRKRVARASQFNMALAA